MKHCREFQQQLIVMNDERFYLEALSPGTTVQTQCAAVPTPSFFIKKKSFSFNNRVGTTRNSTEPTQTAALRETL